MLDNLLEGVLKPDVYDPTLNPRYRDVLGHYGVVALPCRVRDPSRLALIRQAAAERVDQSETAIRSLEQQRTAVGTGVLLVELGDNGLVKKIGKQTLCRGMLGHVKASDVVQSLSATAFYHAGAFPLSELVNYPG